MSNVEFNEETDSVFKANRGENQSRSALVNFLIKKGFFKNEQQSRICIIVVALILFGAAGFLYVKYIKLQKIEAITLTGTPLILPIENE